MLEKILSSVSVAVCKDFFPVIHEKLERFYTIIVPIKGVPLQSPKRAVHYALESANLDALKVLLKYGADIFSRGWEEDVISDVRYKLPVEFLCKEVEKGDAAKKERVVALVMYLVEDVLYPLLNKTCNSLKVQSLGQSFFKELFRYDLADDFLAKVKLEKFEVLFSDQKWETLWDFLVDLGCGEIAFSDRASADPRIFTLVSVLLNQGRSIPENKRQDFLRILNWSLDSSLTVVSEHEFRFGKKVSLNESDRRRNMARDFIRLHATDSLFTNFCREVYTTVASEILSEQMRLLVDDLCSLAALM